MIGVVKLPILRHRDVLKRYVINFKRHDFGHREKTSRYSVSMVLGYVRNDYNSTRGNKYLVVKTVIKTEGSTQPGNRFLPSWCVICLRTHIILFC